MSIVNTGRVRVLVVDDSAFARKVIREVLSKDPDIDVVGIARDGLDALEKIAELAPDVVTLDLLMPNLDGVGVLKALAVRPKRPAVVIVSMTEEESEVGVMALQAGAFDVVRKPTALAMDQLYELGDELRAKVLAASRATNPVPTRSPTREKAVATPARTQVLLIGASTGGPQAITQVLRTLPEAFPVPIAVVLHMPTGYTEAFARRVDTESALEVMEARDGLEMVAGRAIIARAGVHLTFARERDAVVCRLELTPTTTPHRPAVDVLFQSGASIFGHGVLAVVLTGMGNDGLVGSRAITLAKGRVLTESESSCVVYGMPRVVAEAGLSTANAAMDSMTQLILSHL